MTDQQNTTALEPEKDLAICEVAYNATWRCSDNKGLDAIMYCYVVLPRYIRAYQAQQARVAELEAQNAEMRAALEDWEKYDEMRYATDDERQHDLKIIIGQRDKVLGREVQP
jgi:alkylation response protein AidB-like acyl-CoA dehydrogenase